MLWCCVWSWLAWSCCLVVSLLVFFERSRGENTTRERRQTAYALGPTLVDGVAESSVNWLLPSHGCASDECLSLSLRDQRAARCPKDVGPLREEPARPLRPRREVARPGEARAARRLDEAALELHERAQVLEQRAVLDGVAPLDQRRAGLEAQRRCPPERRPSRPPLSCRRGQCPLRRGPLPCSCRGRA